MEDHLQGAVIGRRAARPLVALVMVLAACAKDAPPPLPVQPLARIELDANRAVEIIGLRRWTPEMVRDSLRKYAPDDGIESDATAANLRNLLGFADAATSIHTVVFDEDEKSTITIAVREPGDSARVHYAAQALDTVPERAAWRNLAAMFVADSSGRLLPIVAGAHLDGYSRLVVDSTVKRRAFAHREGYEFESPADSLAARPILDSLARRISNADFGEAVETIDKSRSAPDRAVAALVLANFPERDRAWHSLLRAATGREQARDALVAQHALIGLSDRAARTVDWSPMDSTIHDVLDGTALAALAPLSTALAATGASTGNAHAWLAKGGEMLTAYVESDNPDIRDAAHALLVKLRGSDLGFEPEPWREWIRTL
jgi:hypothetical protein